MRFVMSADLKTALIAEAKAAGFDSVRVTRPDTLGEAGARLAAFLADGRHGDMTWMEANADRRRDPRVLWPDVRSIVMFGLNYGPSTDPLAALEDASRGVVSVYAQGRDYHDIVKSGLKRVARWLAAASPGADVKVFVDTAPLMEKPLAQAAGIGWQGKHTNLVSREHGSWLFLGALLTTADLPPDAAEPPLPVESVGAGPEAQVLLDREVPVEREALRHVADVTLDLSGLLGDVEAEQVRGTRGRREQPAQHPDGGGLAGAVGAEEAEDLARPNRERDPVDGLEGAKAAAQLAAPPPPALPPRSRSPPCCRLAAGQVEEGVLQAGADLAYLLHPSACPGEGRGE